MVISLLDTYLAPIHLEWTSSLKTIKKILLRKKLRQKSKKVARLLPAFTNRKSQNPERPNQRRVLIDQAWLLSTRGSFPRILKTSTI